MKNYELRSFDDPLALAHAAAKAWIAKVEQAGHAGHLHYVALSGGRIARQFFGAIVENAKKLNVSVASVHFFWADERCVPPDDPESNFKLAKQWLLEPLNIPANQIHRIRGESIPEQAAHEAAAELRHLIPPGTEGQPALDLVFLGMGEDGHVASLFPGMPAGQVNSTEAYLAVTASKPPPRRVTLTYAALRAAREVWVLASGPGKAEALQKSLMPGEATPLARLLGMHDQTVIFSDIRS